LLPGQIDWTIEDFVKWNNGRSKDSKIYSTDFSFDFPQVNKSFDFALILHPCYELAKKRSPSDRYSYKANYVCVELFIGKSENPKMEVGFELVGTKVRSDCQFGFVYRSNYFIELFGHSDLEKNPEEYLVDGNLQIRCNFTIHYPQVVKVSNPITYFY
jgi:hypothetical protein